MEMRFLREITLIDLPFKLMIYIQGYVFRYLHILACDV